MLIDLNRIKNSLITDNLLCAQIPPVALKVPSHFCARFSPSLASFVRNPRFVF